MHRIITILAALWCLQGAIAQNFTITELPTQKQLPVANVHRIMQDSEGFLWYATQGGGLCRDNGYDIDVFRSDRLHPDLIGKSNFVVSLEEDSLHRILFTTTDGAYVLDKTTYHISCLDPDLKGRRADAIMAASDGTVWVASSKKIFHYDSNFNRLASYPSQWRGKDVWTTRFYEDTDGRIIGIQWEGGLVAYNNRNDSFVPLPWPDGVTPNNIIRDPVTRQMWVSTWGKGIVKYSPETGQYQEQKSTQQGGEISMQILDICLDSAKRRIWATTMSNLECYIISGDTLVPAAIDGIDSDEINILDGLAIDKTGNLWVAGYSPSSFVISENTDNVLRKHTIAGENNIGKYLMIWNAAPEDDFLWISQVRLGLSIYDLETNRSKHPGPDDLLQSEETRRFRKCLNRKGVWIFTGKQLYHVWYDKGTFHKKLTASSKSDILSVFDDGLGHIYLGTSNGIEIYTESDGGMNRILRNLHNVPHINKSSDGILYFAITGGNLMCLAKDGNTHTFNDISDVSSIAVGGDGDVWVSTANGDLFYINSRTNASTIDSVGSNSNGDAINQLTIDNAGHLWLLSDQYLKEYNPQTGAYRIFRNHQHNIGLNFFCQVNPNGNEVWVCGASGVINIPSSVGIDSPSSVVAPKFTTATIDGVIRIIGAGQNELEINPDVTTVELQFSTLNYLNADKISYAYRLRGMNDEWQYLTVGNNKISFIGLAKGHYTLEVKATDEYGCWGDNVASLQINRLPAWYESWPAHAIYAILAATVIYLTIRRYISRQKRTQQQNIEKELTEMKFRFFTNISHELRTPLSLIMTPVESLIKRIEQWQDRNDADKRFANIKDQLTLVNNNAGRLLTLVNRLLDFRKLEMGQQRLDLTSGDVFDFIRTVCETFRPMSQNKGIGLGCAIPNKNLYMYFDANKLQLILSNLLSNAFKFTGEGGYITVSVSETPDGMISIIVSDTGCGISAADQTHIFDRYYQSRNHTDITGTGIGLNMVRDFTTMHRGTVSVKSKEGEGSTFTVLIPSTLKPEAGQQLPEISVTAGSLAPGPTVNDLEDNPTLLIVDDNDEFRQFLAGELADNYVILQASNGRDAEEIVKTSNVDLVVSDVMMPLVDGYELCRRLKSDIDTSHIMVILLTARAAESSKMTGYKAGADDYLSKPFNMEMLQLRIRHLMTFRKLRNEKFAKEEEVKVEEVALTELDREFLQKAMSVVERNIRNDRYDILAFCDDMCMSRSTLYRKVISLTGQKPTEFIRTLRLKHAVRLLKEKKYSINEISDMCGFSSASYFCRCFKAQFGTQPGNYTEAVTADTSLKPS